MLVTLTAFFEYKEDGGRFPNPPSYSVATTLPSYDEAERSKAEAAIPLVTGRVTVPVLFSDIGPNFSVSRHILIHQQKYHVSK